MRNVARAALMAILAISSTVPLYPVHAAPAPAPRPSLGVASWYGPGFHGRLTANGERYNMNELTAAHRSLPFGTKVKVTNKSNGKSVVVRINDRGPYIGKRVIDLSKAAAQRIGMVDAGIMTVELEILA
jgi:rare lipoprotein A